MNYLTAFGRLGAGGRATLAHPGGDLAGAYDRPSLMRTDGDPSRSDDRKREARVPYEAGAAEGHARGAPAYAPIIPS